MLTKQARKRAVKIDRAYRERERWPEVTPEHVEQIDKMLAPEFAKGHWQTVESE